MYAWTDGASKEEPGNRASWDAALPKLIVSDSSVSAEDHLLLPGMSVLTARV